MRNNAAIHLHPETAREHIRKGAERALERFKNEKFGIVRLNPPYRWVCSYRHETGKEGRERIETHPDSVIGVMNRIYGK